MGRHKQGFPLKMFVQILKNLTLGLDVKGTGTIVKYRHRGIFEERPGDRHTLFLSAGQTKPLLADHGMIPIRHRIRKFTDLCRLPAGNHLFVRGIRIVIRDVRCDRIGKQKYILHGVTIGSGDLVSVVCLDILPVNGDRALMDFLKCLKHPQEHGFSASCLPHDPNLLSIGNIKGYIIQQFIFICLC